MIFGSTAIKYLFPDFEREPKDLDIILRDPPINRKNKEFFWTLAFECIDTDKPVCTPDELYTIKIAHLHHDINWIKHLQDSWFLKDKGAEIIPGFYYALRRDFSLLHDKRVNLNQPVEEFFNGNVKRKFKHDDLHEMFKFDDVPKYQLISKHDGTAAVSREKYDDLSKTDQIKVIVEETMVIAYERYLQEESNMSSFKIKSAFRRAYQDLVTRMTKGWFTKEMILDSYVILGSGIDFYVGQFKEKIKEIK